MEITFLLTIMLLVLFIAPLLLGESETNPNI